MSKNKLDLIVHIIAKRMSIERDRVRKNVNKIEHGAPKDPVQSSGVQQFDPEFSLSGSSNRISNGLVGGGDGFGPIFFFAFRRMRANSVMFFLVYHLLQSLFRRGRIFTRQFLIVCTKLLDAEIPWRNVNIELWNKRVLILRIATNSPPNFHILLSVLIICGILCIAAKQLPKPFRILL